MNDINNQINEVLRLAGVNDTIMEGPLGSGGWTPKKAISNLKKGYNNKKELNDINNVRDSHNKKIMNYLEDIMKSINMSANWGNNIYTCGMDKHGFYIQGKHVPSPLNTSREAYKLYYGDDDYEKVSFNSEKYGNKIYMTKLTAYVKKNKSLPSKSQLLKYINNLIETRYNQEMKNNDNKHTHLATNDVDNF